MRADTCDTAIQDRLMTEYVQAHLLHPQPKFSLISLRTNRPHIRY